MNHKLLPLVFVLFVTACVPITPEPVSPEPTVATADCYRKGVVDGYALRPGQSAIDPPDEDAPGYVDIIRVGSTLEDETLTAVFYLRELPEELEFNRKGIPRPDVHDDDKNSETRFAIEYLWHILIDADGDSQGSTGFPAFKSEYVLMAYYFSEKDSEPEIRPTRDAIQILLLKRDPHDHTYSREVYWIEPSPSLSFSHEEHTITLTAEIPDISSESYLQFETMDFLMTTNVVDVPHSIDKISCEPEQY